MPSDWKRRPTPWKRASGATMSASGTPTARQAAIAASAFSTLWRPGTGSVKRTSSTVKAAPRGSSATSAPRTSAPAAEAEHGGALGERREVRGLPHHERLARARARNVANIAATSSISRWSRCRFSTTPTAGS